MRVVSAYHPIVPYTTCHIGLADLGFDWIEALRMLAYSAKVRANVETLAITDQELPVPHLRYKTTEESLMLWVLEVSLLYLESDDFDQDTVFISPDALVFGPLDLFGQWDLGVLYRGVKYGKHPLLNGFQWWPLASKARLVTFYRECLSIARDLSKGQKRWGGDTVPLVRLLSPIIPGVHRRNGLVLCVLPAVLHADVTTCKLQRILKHPPGTITASVLDFKYWNKRYMKEVFDREFQ